MSSQLPSPSTPACEESVAALNALTGGGDLSPIVARFISYAAAVGGNELKRNPPIHSLPSKSCAIIPPPFAHRVTTPQPKLRQTQKRKKKKTPVVTVTKTPTTTTAAHSAPTKSKTTKKKSPVLSMKQNQTQCINNDIHEWSRPNSLLTMATHLMK